MTDEQEVEAVREFLRGLAAKESWGEKVYRVAEIEQLAIADDSRISRTTVRAVVAQMLKGPSPTMEGTLKEGVSFTRAGHLQAIGAAW